MKRKVSLIILVVFLISVFCSSAVLAVVDSNPCIEMVNRDAYAEGGQVIRFDIEVYGSGYMAEIGASQLVVYEADGTYVRTYYATNPMYEEFMMSTNALQHTSYIRFRGDVGVSYYAIIYYTATNMNGITGTVTVSTNTATCIA